MSRFFQFTLNQHKTERIQAIRNMGKAIAEEIRIRMDRQIIQIETVLTNASERRPNGPEMARLEGINEKMRSLLAQYPS